MKADRVDHRSLESCDKDSHLFVESLRDDMNRYLLGRGIRCKSARDDLISEAKLRVLTARRASRKCGVANPGQRYDGDRPLVWRCLRQSLADEARRRQRSPVVQAACLKEELVSPAPCMTADSTRNLNALLQQVGGDDETLLRRIYLSRESRCRIATEQGVDSTTIGRREKRALKRVRKIANSVGFEIQ